MRPPAIRAVGVIVPAHDEEETLATCLTSIQEAASVLNIRTGVVVVADACRDASASVARRAGADVVRSAWANVGRARQAGADAFTRAATEAIDRLWLAFTDADSAVSPDWLRHQIEMADLGGDAHVGTVVLADGGLAEGVRHRFDTEYRAWRQQPGMVHHPHVHGANLGVRASAFSSVGGFRARPVHEDRCLVKRLDQRRNLVVQRSHDVPVTTSARVAGRARAGVATDLLRLSS